MSDDASSHELDSEGLASYGSALEAFAQNAAPVGADISADDAMARLQAILLRSGNDFTGARMNSEDSDTAAIAESAAALGSEIVGGLNQMTDAVADVGMPLLTVDRIVAAVAAVVPEPSAQADVFEPENAFKAWTEAVTLAIGTARFANGIEATTRCGLSLVSYCAALVATTNR